jgi:hypothetical protein
MLFVSAVLLLYTAVVAPVQIFLWDYSNPCEHFPTLYLDILVDSFFLVDMPSPIFFLQRPTHPVFTPACIERISSSLWLTRHAVANPLSILLCPYPLNLHVPVGKQFEVMLEFFMGATDKSENYCDDIQLIAVKNLTSLGGFWFDLFTSIPWSYFDLDSFRVSSI